MKNGNSLKTVGASTLSSLPVCSYGRWGSPTLRATLAFGGGSRVFSNLTDWWSTGLCQSSPCTHNSALARMQMAPASREASSCITAPPEPESTCDLAVLHKPAQNLGPPEESGLIRGSATGWLLSGAEADRGLQSRGWQGALGLSLSRVPC